MDIFRFPINVRSVLLATVCSIFSVCVVVPQPIYSIDFNLKDANFAIKIERLVDKLKKYKDKLNSDKIIETALELKDEIAGYTGKKIELKKELEKIEKDIKKETKMSSKDFKRVKEFILAKERKADHRAMVMLSYLQENPSVSFEEYQEIYSIARGKGEAEEVKVNATVAIGCVLVLSGALLGILCIEFPILSQPAQWAAGTGMAMIGEGLAQEAIEKNKK